MFSSFPLALFVLGMAGATFAQPYGLTVRQPNSTLQMPQSPAAYGYALTNAYTGFASLIGATTPPGETNRLFVLERAGRIVVITNLDISTGERALFLDISDRTRANGEHGLLGLAFHPDYADNRSFFVFYSYTDGVSVHNRLSRFETSSTDANQALAESEVVLFSQPDEASNHNGGDIQFGPDGYLYVSLGDEGNQSDSLQNSQRIDKDFFAGILRIDVDKLGTNLAPNPHPALMGQVNYFVPADNPFVGATQFNGVPVNPASVRTEFWAVGLRNPWRISFDPATGALFCGDVGGGAREEINLIVKGGNYGWVFREGTLAGPDPTRQGPAGFASIPPILEYAHGSGLFQGNSVTGGVLYRGGRISQLTGKYIFADYVSGNIWALTPDGTNAASNFERLTGRGSVVSFATDPRNGDVLLVNLGGFIQRLIYNTNVVSGTPLPATLADTGVFADVTSLTPHAGIVPYGVNVPFWSDNAKKTRWFSVPNLNQTIAFNREGSWSFPNGTVWVKHFDLELTTGVPASAKRLETRLLVKNPDGVYGVTYRWGSSTSNATLVPEEGLDEEFVINDGGIQRTQVWHYPGRSECRTCHTTAAGFALGFNTEQLNRDFNYAGVTDNQLRALDHVNYFVPAVTNRHTLRALAHPTNAAYSAEYRVRSYLAANCAQCHRPGSSTVGSWDARIENPLSLAGIVNGVLRDNLGDANNRVVAPNDPAHSVLLTRIAQNGPLRMPPLASNLPDTNAINLLTAWINSLGSYRTFEQWQWAYFDSTTAPGTGALEDFDGDGSLNFTEYLVGTNPVSPTDAWKTSLVMDGNTAQIRFPQIANRGFEVQFTPSLQPPIVWEPLDVPANRPFISATNFEAVIPDAPAGPARFYRVRIFEP
ncbi:MAG: PQQ-dependent sugar dehydrogenase [Verrucomicrobiota bacterium]